jgi:type IV pilus modification protein PilV
MKNIVAKIRRAIKEKGFTLVEVLVAITVLSFGLLAVASMQLAAIQANSTARELTDALTVAQDKMEKLIGLDFNDADLNDSNGDGSAGLDKPTKAQIVAAGDALISGAADHAETVTLGARNYYLYWNVDDSMSNIKTIRVIVAWSEKGMRRTALDYIKY